MLMMLGSSSRFIAASQSLAQLMLMMLCRSSGSIAFAEPSRADAHDAGQLFSLHRCFAEPGPADAHDAVQVFWFDCCLRGV